MSWLQKNILILVLTLLPFLILGWFWNQIPEEIPTHWNAKGEADAWGPKWFGMGLLPVLGIVMQVIYWLVPVLDPKRRVEEFAPTLHKLQVGTAMFNLVVFLGILGVVLNWMESPVDVIIWSVLGLFALIGNYLSKVKPNYFIGIRTPWALEDEDNWRKTHRVGGRLMFGGSILLLGLSFFFEKEVFAMVFLVIILAVSFAPFIYSYLLFRQKKNAES